MGERQVDIGYELPSQAQVAVFARACILFAHRHDQIGKLESGAYKIGPMSHYSPPDLMGGQPWGFLYKDTCTVSALLDKDLDVSQLKVVRGLVAADHGSDAGVLRWVYSYRFDSNGQTFSSQKLTHITNGEKESKDLQSLNDINLDNTYIPDDISQRLAYDIDMQTVTAGDFDQITEVVYGKMRQVDAAERDYSETRKGTYVSYFDW